MEMEEAKEEEKKEKEGEDRNPDSHVGEVEEKHALPQSTDASPRIFKS